MDFTSLLTLTPAWDLLSLLSVSSPCQNSLLPGHVFWELTPYHLFSIFRTAFLKALLDLGRRYENWMLNQAVFRASDVLSEI